MMMMIIMIMIMKQWQIEEEQAVSKWPHFKRW